MGTVKVTNIEPIADNGTITFGSSGDTLALAAGATTSGFGKIGQVVYASTTTQFNTASSTFVDTGFDISITPSSTSSKILLIYNPHFRLYNSSSADADGFYKINDGSSDIYESKLQVYDYGNNGTLINVSPSIVVRHSPSTTSQKTYSLYLRLQAGTLIQFSQANRLSTAIAMEILD